MFNKEEFESAYAKAIKALKASEKITREHLQSLSRSVLEVIHNPLCGDIAYVNRLLEVLTPVNRKVAVLYFQEFTGFNCDKGVFTTKNKKAYVEHAAKAQKFLEDPMNNIWSWAGREIDVEKKEFDLDRLKKMTETLVKKADKAGIQQIEILRAVMSAGVKIETILEMMGELEGYEITVK